METPLPASTPPGRLTTMTHAALFVLGFSLVFVIGFGGAATVLGRIFEGYKPLLAKIGGIVVILLGLFTLRLIKIPFLYYDTRPEWNIEKGGGVLSSLLMGVFFAAGWSPCIGPTLGAILTLGMNQQSATQAMILSSGYAIGLGVPFLIIGLGVDRAMRFVRRFRRYMRAVEIGSGILLILVGFLILTEQMTAIAAWALRNNLYFDLPLGDATAAPTYLIAIIGGLISFFSPCVLPLVPAYAGYISSRAVASQAK